MPHILVVDDEDQVRFALKRRLEREGYTVTVAASAKEADELIRSQNPSFDIVISDMAMEEPDSGLKVLRDAIAHDLFTEVIVLTAYGNVANAVESMRRGAFDYLEKGLPGVDVYELLVLKTANALERRQITKRTLDRIEQYAAQRQGR